MEDISRQLNELKELALLGAKNVLSVKDVAALMGKSEKTIRNTIEDYPHYKDPYGHIWFKRSEIEQWQCTIKCACVPAILNNIQL